MTTKAYPPNTGTGGGLTTTTQANFIPEIWSDEVIGAYKSNLVVANLVTKMMHQGKKGDTIHIPTPTRADANAKAANTAVTLIFNTEGVTNVSIDKHYEYSRLIEDIADVQALSSMRRFYTDDAGYALAKQVDTDLFREAANLNGGDGGYANDDDDWGAAAVIGGDGSTTYDSSAQNQTALTDEGIRTMIQTLDDNDVPMMERAFVVPPSAKKTLLGISRYTEQAFIGDGNAIKTGKIGELYGIPVFVSTNCPTPTTATGGAGTAAGRIGMLIHKSALVLIEQMSVRSQTQYKQEYLADLFTSDTIYGTGELRNDGGILFAVPA